LIQKSWQIGIMGKNCGKAGSLTPAQNDDNFERKLMEHL
jgi:hypothetical protein